MDQEKFWCLLAKKLADEISGAELEELNTFFEEDPQLKEIDSTLSAFWKLEPAPIEKEPAVEKLWEKIKRRL